MRRRSWTKAEDDKILKMNAEGYNLPEVAEELGRPYIQVKWRAGVLNLKFERVRPERGQGQPFRITKKKVEPTNFIKNDGSIHPRTLEAMSRFGGVPINYKDGSYRNSRVVWYPNGRIEIDGEKATLGELLEKAGLIKR